MPLGSSVQRYGPPGGASRLLDAGNVSAAVQKELDQLAQKQQRASEAPPEHGWRGLLHTITNEPVIRQALGGLGRGLDIIGRPGQAIEALGEEKIKSVKGAVQGLAAGGDLGNQVADFARLARAAVLPVSTPSEVGALGSGIIGHNKTGGMDVIRDLGVPMQGGGRWGGFGRGIAALGVDVATDPFTWLMPGKSAADTAESLSRKLAMTTASPEARKAVEDAVAGSVRATSKETKKLAVSELRAAVNKGVAKSTEEQRALLEAWDKGTLKAMPEIAKAREAARANAVMNNFATGAIKNQERAAVKDFIQQHGARLSDELMTAAEGMTHNRLTMKAGFFGKGIPGLGSAQVLSPEAGAKLWSPLGHAGEFLGSTGVGQKATDLFKVEKGLIGKAQEFRNAAQMKRGFEDMIPAQKHVSELFGDVTKDQMNQMFSNFEKGVPTQGLTKSGKALADVQNAGADFLHNTQDMLRKQGFSDEEILRSTVPHLQLNSWKNRKLGLDFLKAREEEFVKSGGKIVYNTVERAKQLGLKPDENFAHALLRTRAQANRLIINQDLYSHFLNTYGTISEKVPGSLGPGNIQWTKLGPRYVSPDLKAALGKNSIYLPKEMNKFFSTYHDLLRSSPDAVTNSLLRSFDTANRGFKRIATVYRPAYHVRNAMSDVFTAFLDGIQSREYVNAAHIMEDTLRGGTHSFKIDGVLDKNASQLWHDFRTTAGGSTFMHTDLERPVGKSLEDLHSLARKIPAKVQMGAEGRENYFRFTHWLGAAKEEFKNLRAGRVLNPDEMEKTWQEAVGAATRRVNKYHFDYNALTPFEQAWAKRAIPFYTYTKKATPLMVESLLLNPGRMSLLPKASQALQNSLGVQPNGVFAHFNIPEYLQGGNISLLGNNEQPSYLNFSGLPTNLLTPQGWGLERGSSGGLSQLLSRTTPLIRGPIELATKKSLFSGRPVTGLPDWLYQTYSPTRSVAPLTSGRDYGLQQVLGLPIGNLPEKTQLSSIKGHELPLSKKIAVMNQQLLDAGLAIRASRRKTGTVYRLVRVAQAGKRSKTLGTYSSSKQAQRAANRIIK